MTPYLLASTLFVLVFLASATRAADPPRGPVIDQYVRQAQACQKALGRPSFPRRISPWDLKGHSPANVLRLWQTRLAQCRETRRQWDYTAWMPQHWINLAACESGSSPPNWQHDSGAYQGAFGFAASSWDRYKSPGDPDNAADASPWAQWQAARRIGAKYGLASPWGCWRGSEHAWVRAGLPEYGTFS